MIDWKNEKVLPLREVPEHVRSRVRGRKLSVATAWRWAQRKHNPLETFKTPGGRFTTMQALDRFLRRCTNDRETEIVDTDDPACGVIAAGREISTTR